MADSKKTVKIVASKPTVKAAAKPPKKVVPSAKETSKASSKKPNSLAVKKVASKPVKKISGKGKPVARARARNGESIAVFIDLDNTNISSDNLLEVFSILQTKGDIVYGKLYGYTDDKVNYFEDTIAEYRLETVGKMRFKTDGVSVVDTRLITDCLNITAKNKFKMVFVWAGLGDMIPIFSCLRANKCKVLTIDNEEFDCTNKFVDQKIKLFSPHTSVKSGAIRYSQTKPINSIIPETPHAKPVAPTPDFLGGRKVPNLPRKKGAPEFGVKEKEFNPEAEGDGISEVDNANLLRLAQTMLMEMEEERKEAERKKPEYIADFGDLESIDDDGNPTKTKRGVTSNAQEKFEPVPVSAAKDDYSEIDDIPGNIDEEPPVSMFADEDVPASSIFADNQSQKQATRDSNDRKSKKEAKKISTQAPAQQKTLTAADINKSNFARGDMFDDFANLSGVPTGGGYDPVKYDPEEDKPTEDDKPGEDPAKDFNSF